jgi:dipeptidyl aminopeptidase/acylaminoacyl peptidase
VRRLRATTTAALLLAGCAAPGFEPGELPAAPIAFVHRTREEGDRRAELLERQASEGRQRPGQGRVRLEDLGELLGIGPDAHSRMLAALGRLALLDPRSGEVERIEAALGGAKPLCWSADRDRLLFASARRRAETQLFEYIRSNREVRPVTHGPEAHPFGCYGPENRLVLVEVRRTPDGPASRLLVTGPGGHDPRPLTDGPADVSPVWSPDGRLIAFASIEPGRGSVIATVAPEAANSDRRTIAVGKEPTFTPDGAWIVYSASSRGRWRLWRMRPDGTGKLLVGRSKYDEHQPAVAPDGRYLVFVGEEPGSVYQKLLLRRFDGSAERPLLDREEGTHPIW